MHNFFEAKDREWRWGFWECQRLRAPSPPAARGSGSAVSSPSGVRGKAPATKAFWCILSSKIAYGGNFFNYLFQLKKWKWCTLKLAVSLIIENHRKYLSLEVTGIEPLKAAINLQKNVRLKHQTGQFFKKYCGSHAGHWHDFRWPYVVHPWSRSNAEAALQTLVTTTTSWWTLKMTCDDSTMNIGPCIIIIIIIIITITIASNLALVSATTQLNTSLHVVVHWCCAFYHFNVLLMFVCLVLQVAEWSRQLWGWYCVKIFCIVLVAVEAAVAGVVVVEVVVVLAIEAAAAFVCFSNVEKFFTTSWVMTTEYTCFLLRHNCCWW